MRDRVKTYIECFVYGDNKQLDHLEKEREITREHRETELMIPPDIGRQAGKLIGLLIRATQAKRVLEFGTCLGYSTLWLAEAVRITGGRLTAIEKENCMCERTMHNLKAAGLTDYVDLILGDAEKEIDKLNPGFDLILQDSDKILYPVMLERTVRLLKINGILIADDALFKPMGMAESLSGATDLYNQLIFKDKRLYSTILPIGDGLAVSVKISD
ncbi:MAG: O-methyltransferase [Candidatus Wallbacteria bacterium HGW-Wallbacteria-1]|jgi:predicted O-methyltransferase YrrM|uniref:O-methyltransferase n=1 Tax=Candidatus Wallbacteria bacterium HGW-Wallbacteria-1 TaxID=2013854 RepID=A0A2N1PJQ5_9BACT|nr:MAG: O-methyltransferase [Candidatus Wallbacteria bacterium HGW-Wallbacteria-1]